MINLVQIVTYFKESRHPDVRDTDENRHTDDCHNNGLLLWTSREVGDNSIIINNYIRDVSNSSGGTGQFDNGINVYRRLASGWRTTTYTIAPIRLSE